MVSISNSRSPGCLVVAAICLLLPSLSGADVAHAPPATHPTVTLPLPPAPAPADVDSSLKTPFSAEPVPSRSKAGSQAAPAHAQSNPPPAHTDGITPAFKQSTAHIQNSNLFSTAHDTQPLSPRQRAEMLIALARRQHVEKNYDLAVNNFAALVLSDAPDEIKRESLLEIAVIAQERNQLEKAQQVYAQFLRKYPDDDSMPEIFLRQGILYRQMGAPVLAQSKFYAVMTSALTLKKGNLDYYRRLVLHSQTEIADTVYAEGNHQEAADYFTRLLRLESTELNKPRIQFKLIHCLAALGKHSETISQAEDFLSRNSGTADEAEVRFLHAMGLKQVGRNQDALQQVLLLLQSQNATAASEPARWAYWQQRSGNTIANQMYQEGDYVNSLAIYTVLAGLNPAPAWQFPVLYQSGLIYERLEQPQKAVVLYRGIVSREAELGADPSPSLKTVIDMARWRAEMIGWQAKAGQLFQPAQTNAQLDSPKPSASAQ